MTQQQIQQLFQLRYNQNNWKQFLSQAFSDARLQLSPDILTGINTDVATQVLRLGYIALNENGIERNIAIYDVTLAPGIILERNRVGLRNLLRKYWKDIDAAFIVYHRPENPNWRFTYVSELTGFDAEGELIKVKTEPKRYTYILGEGESCRTAAERFAIITKKGNKTSLDDVKDAFSVEKLSKSFFDEYKKHYELFCDYMVSKPNIRQTIFNGNEKAIRDFNKKLLGRIVFLYFIQKKGWMGVPENSAWGVGDQNFLWNLFNNSRNKELFYSEYLTRLFFDTLNMPRPNDIIELIKGEKIKIPFLNGGLFEEDDKNYRNLIFPDELFENLFLFFNQFNFTIYEDDPDDQTIAVDPEMLGHIFENLLEDNKDKGAFYTPKEIVHYMCQESLIEYLCTTLDIEDEAKEKEALTALLKQKEIDDILKPEIKNINDALDKVKICDPAIGSGAFPMGLLKEIFTAKQTLYTFEHGSAEGFDASGVKLDIIQNSIYGVDIEKGAVDIARLRFWLSLVVDEEAPKALPNLDYKIVVGNSLVSKLGDEIINIDWEVKEGTQTDHLSDPHLSKRKDLLQKISDEQKEFFDPNSDKKKLAADIRNLKIDLLVNQLEQMIKVTQQETQPKKVNYKSNKNYVIATELHLKTLYWKQQIEKLQTYKENPEAKLNFFDWKLDFPEVMNEQINSNAGFDIVIGNPPYVQLQKNGGALAKQFEKQAYQTFERTGDIYSLFYEKGIQLLKINGILTYITSNKWMRAAYGKSTRAFLCQHQPIALIDLGSGIFASATVDTNILTIRKSAEKPDTYALKALDISNEKEITNFSVFDDKWINITLLSEDRWSITTTIEQNIREKIERIGKPLKDWDISIYYGIKTGYNKAFIIDGKKKDELIAQDPKSAEIIKPILRGRDIKRYKAEFADLWLINSHNGVKSLGIPRIKVKEDYPAIYNHLNQYRERLIKRQDKGDHWTNLRNCAYLEEFEKEKIVYNDICHELTFALVPDGVVFNNTAYFINIKSRYLIALLNSKLIDWYYKTISVQLGDKAVRMFSIYVEIIPISVISEKNQQPFVTLVEQILEYKSQGSDTTALEQQIDNMVYKLYELTYEEVKVIDPDFELSQQEYEAIKL